MYSAIQFNSVNDPLPDILYGKLKFLYFLPFLLEREREKVFLIVSHKIVIGSSYCSCTFLIIFILKSTWLPRKYIHLLENFLHPRILDNPQNEVDSLLWISFFCALILLPRTGSFIFDWNEKVMYVCLSSKFAWVCIQWFPCSTHFSSFYYSHILYKSLCVFRKNFCFFFFFL